MGADYTAIAILGIKIDYEMVPMLKKTVKKPAFEHNYSEDDVFHPKTGDKLWTDEMQEVDSDSRKYALEHIDFCDYDGIYEQYFVDGKLASNCLCKFDDYKISCYGSDENDEYWIGIVADETYSNGGEDEDFENVPDDLKSTLKKILEPYGLWNEENFGLFSILHCSV